MSAFGSLRVSISMAQHHEMYATRYQWYAKMVIPQCVHTETYSVTSLLVDRDTFYIQPP